METKTYDKTGTTLSFDNGILILKYGAGKPDITVVSAEFGWAMFELDQMCEAHSPMAILVCGEHLLSRTIMSMRESMRFITFAKSPCISKMALCCGDKFVHSIAATLRILIGKPVQYFDKETDAIAWLAT